MRNIANFEERFELRGARFFAREQNKTAYVDFGYRIVKGVQSTYITGNKEAHSAKFDTFMLEIGSVEVNGQSKKIYTQDHVDYTSADGKRSSGVVTFDQEHFMYAIKDVFKETFHPLHSCEVNYIFPHIYERPDLLGLDLETIYRKLGQDVPEKAKGSSPSLSDIEAEVKKLKTKKKSEESSEGGKPAVLDLFISVENNKDGNPLWKYTIKYDGKFAKNNGSFEKKGSASYYNAACLALALSKISTTKESVPIKIHTRSKALFDVLDGGFLETWSQSGWKKDSGEKVKNYVILQTVKDNLDRLGGKYSCVLSDEDFAAA